MNEPQKPPATVALPQTAQNEAAFGDPTAEALRMLVGLLNEGRIDLETYKASLLALMGKRPRAQNGKKTGVLTTN